MSVFHILWCVIIALGPSSAETKKQALLLNFKEQQYLVNLVKQDEEARKYLHSIKKQAELVLREQPLPLSVIHYEGLLDADPQRVVTEQSLQDMDRLIVLLYAYYGAREQIYAAKAKSYILAWVNVYRATGNPINENKLEPIIYSYQVMKDFFSPAEKEKINRWLSQIAEAEMANPKIPENNWKSKQIKLIGTIGLILQNQQYVQYAIEGFRNYINNALYEDGTSRDLHQRDAMSYHVSGLTPLLNFAFTLDQFGENKNFKFFQFQSPNGGSLKKSVDYVVPYAKREKVHKEWVNTKVELDKRRAEAGLAEYQPGRPFDPARSLEMFELASYFDEQYKTVVQNLVTEDFKNYNSWFSVLIQAGRQGK